MSIFKDLRDSFKIIIMLPGYILAGVIWVGFNVAGLLALPFLKLSGSTRPRTKEEIPTLKLEWNFEHDRTYMPSTVRCSVRGIAETERELLSRALGLFSSGAVTQESHVEILQLQVQEAWILHFCGPDCCPPELLLKVEKNNYLFVGGTRYSHGLAVFADKEECLIPFTRSLEVTRTTRSHIPLRFVRTGAPIVHNERNANVEIEFESVQGFYCEFLRMDQLPQEFKDGFTPLTELPTNPSQAFVGPSRGSQGPNQEGSQEEPRIGR